MARRPPVVTVAELAALARQLEPYDARRRAAIERTALLAVAIGGRAVCMAWPSVDHRPSPRQLAARARPRDGFSAFTS